MPYRGRDYALRSLGHLRGFVFRWQRWVQLSPNWNHDHCHGCWARFLISHPASPEDRVYNEGWVTLWPCGETATEPIRHGDMLRIPSPKPGGFQLDWICAESFESDREELEFVVDPHHPQWKQAGLLST